MLRRFALSFSTKLSVAAGFFGRVERTHDAEEVAHGLERKRLLSQGHHRTGSSIGGPPAVVAATSGSVYPNRSGATMSSGSRTGKGRGGQPTPLGALLGGARDVAARRSGAALDPDSWRRVVGARIATRTRPGRLQAGMLTIHVATAVWAQELSLLSTEMLTRLRDVGLDVTAVRFRVDPMLGRSAQALPKPARAVDTSRLPAELSEHLRQIDDPELRAAVASAAASWLSRTSTRRGR